MEGSLNRPTIGVVPTPAPTPSAEDREMARQLVELVAARGAPRVVVGRPLPPAVHRAATALADALDELRLDLAELARRARTTASAGGRLRLAGERADLAEGYVACIAEALAALRAAGAALDVGIRRSTTPEEDGGSAVRFGW